MRGNAAFRVISRPWRPVGRQSGQRNRLLAGDARPPPAQEDSGLREWCAVEQARFQAAPGRAADGGLVTTSAASPYVLPGVSPSSVHVVVGNELPHPRSASPISCTAAASLRSIALRNRSRSAGDACRPGLVGAIATQSSRVDSTCACFECEPPPYHDRGAAHERRNLFFARYRRIPETAPIGAYTGSVRYAWCQDGRY